MSVILGWLATNKDAIQAISSLTAFVAAIATSFAAFLAWRNFRQGIRLERAKSLVQFCEKFYESKEPNYKNVRDLLDSDSPSIQVNALVNQQSSEFTDYLNFFEILAYLQFSRQLQRDDVIAMFDYYLKCLKKHPEVNSYIANRLHGYENLRNLLADL